MKFAYPTELLKAELDLCRTKIGLYEERHGKTLAKKMIGYIGLKKQEERILETLKKRKKK